MGGRDLDLSLGRGELVAVVSQKDSRGDKRRWLVDAGGEDQRPALNLCVVFVSPPLTLVLPVKFDRPVLTALTITKKPMIITKLY